MGNNSGITERPYIARSFLFCRLMGAELFKEAYIPPAQRVIADRVVNGCPGRVGIGGL